MDGDKTPDGEDERQIELSSISAIFPEIVLDAQDPFSASIDLPVTPSVPLPVAFPEPSDGTSVAGGKEVEPEPRLETHLLSHLPPLHLRITLPEGYPATRPPIFRLSTAPKWVLDVILERLSSDGQRLWEDFGHDQVVFAYIDHLQQATENTFGILDGKDSLEVPQDLKISLLDFDIQAKRIAFEKETFDCGVCLDPKKGSACHRMLDCGHVFCRECLQDYYKNAITEGDLASVRCLAPDCAKKRSTARKRRKPKTHISPSELLQIPLEHDIVKRYVTLKHKAELESDKNTIYCPRKWCQGAARSKKHKKPTDPLNLESSEEESEQENESAPKTGYKAWGDLLAICEDCSFAFCSRCFQGWHGEFAICAPRTATGELTEEDKASLEYLKLHTTPCPTCAAPAQKTHGCNHMICFRCNTHFCYLCSAWLEAANPYQHYNDTKTGCYMRLWELEGGDGDDVGIEFAGGVQPRELAIRQQEAVDEIQVDQPIIELQEQPLAVDAAIAEPRLNPIVPLPVPVAREGPLVLRIGQIPARPAAPIAQLAQPIQRRGQPANRGAPAARRGRGQGRGAAIVRRAFARRDAEVAEQARLEEERILRRAAIRRIARAEGEVGMDAIRRGAQVVDGRIIEPAAAGGGRAGPLANALAHDHANAHALDEAHLRWVQNFVNLALNDQEDQIEWDSDDEEDPEAWRIPER